MELIRNGVDPPSQETSASTLPPFYSVDEDESTDAATTKKKAKAKKVYTPRGTSYTTFEDVLLCRAGLATRMDAICGTEQNGTRLRRYMPTSIIKRNMCNPTRLCLIATPTLSNIGVL